jgi:4'-phosphopantetheinyl transferase
MQSNDYWGQPADRPLATMDEVHIWRSFLNPPLWHVSALKQILAPDERARADRFVRAEDRTRFIVGRGVLRTILGRYLGLDPRQLQFSYNPFGKPALEAAAGGELIRFNVSHSGNIALYAVASGRAIGVDIERIRLDFGTEDIAQRFFSEREVATLRALPASCRLEAFFACWTRKEAYLKARGNGLSLPLDGFDVSLVPGHPAALLDVNNDSKEAARWSLRDLFPGPDHVAALAVEGHDWCLKCWQWPEPSRVECRVRDRSPDRCAWE